MHDRHRSDDLSLRASMLDLPGALVTLYRERLTELTRDKNARAWGSLRREAAINTLGDDATAQAIDALIDAPRGCS